MGLTTPIKEAQTLMSKIPPSQQIQEALRALLAEGLPAGATDVTRE